MANTEYREIHESERALIKSLNSCTFLPGSYVKRFVRDMSGAKIITEKQLRYLYKTAYSYRRQLRAENSPLLDVWKKIADGTNRRWDDLKPAEFKTKTQEWFDQISIDPATASAEELQ
jgi:hypothetical protein